MNFKLMIGQFLNDSYFCGLDIGSQKIKACLFSVRNAQNMDLLAVFETDTRGFRDTSVNDLGEFSSSIGSALEALSRKTQIRFRDVYLAIGGDMVETRVSRAVIPLAERGNKVITQHDVELVRRQARVLGVRLDEEVVHDFIRQYKVDDVNIALNPVGLYGRKLEVESLLVISGINRLRNLAKAVKRSGYGVNRVFFGGHVLTEALLEREKRVEGAVLVDVGARTTQVFVFKEGLLKNYISRDFGSENMTLSIASVLGIGRDLAEDIKRSYARVSDAGADDTAEEILIKKEQAFVPVKRAMLNTAIGQEADKITALVQEAVTGSGFEGQIKGGVVMTGGGSLLPGLMERVETVIGLPVRLGRGILGLNNAAAYCTCTSVAEVAYKGSARYVFDSRRPRDWWEAARSRVDELFNEYF